MWWRLDRTTREERPAVPMYVLVESPPNDYTGVTHSRSGPETKVDKTHMQVRLAEKPDGHQRCSPTAVGVVLADGCLTLALPRCRAAFRGVAPAGCRTVGGGAVMVGGGAALGGDSGWFPL